jgi:hypothetical protein
MHPLNIFLFHPPINYYLKTCGVIMHLLYLQGTSRDVGAGSPRPYRMYESLFINMIKGKKQRLWMNPVRS